MVRLFFVVSAASAAVLLGGCPSGLWMAPPAPDGPRLTRLEARPAGGVAGCPLTLVFAFDAGHDEIVKAVAGLARSLGRPARAGRALPPVSPDAVQGDPRGEAPPPAGPARARPGPIHL